MEQLKLLRYLYALNQTKGFGVKSAKTLVDYFGDIASVFEFENKPSIQDENPKLKALRAELKKGFLSSVCALSAHKELDFLARKNAALIHYGQKNYPKLLSQCPDAPLGLMVKGSIPESNFWISVVGTNTTSYGIGLRLLSHRKKRFSPVKPDYSLGIGQRN